MKIKRVRTALVSTNRIHAMVIVRCLSCSGLPPEKWSSVREDI